MIYEMGGAAGWGGGSVTTKIRGEGRGGENGVRKYLVSQSFRKARAGGKGGQTRSALSPFYKEALTLAYSAESDNGPYAPSALTLRSDNGIL
jgi:hypothetical protein